MNQAEEPRSLAKAWIYFVRALWWHCPTCGTKPIFSPVHQVRSLHDWFTPLDGCSRCGYAYDRESGYFLMAIWGVNYGVVALGGIGTYLVLRVCTDLSPQFLFFVCVLPAPFLSILLARHAKSLFLAMDHFCDPHVRVIKS